MKTVDLKQFVLAYLTTAAWVTCESNECQEFTKDAKLRAERDCIEFINKVRARFGEKKALELLTIAGNDLTYLAPHDLFLTRNGHGAGFWDKEDTYGVIESAILTKNSGRNVKR